MTLEFTRDRKSMSVFVQRESDYSLLVKGAPEGVLERCTTVLLENGTVVAMNEDLKREILQKVTSFATDALRCLGLAISEFTGDLAIHLSEFYE